MIIYTLAIPESRNRLCLRFCSYLNDFICFKSVPQVLVVIDVAQLVAHDSRIAYHGVDVRVRMAIDPHINDSLC